MTAAVETNEHVLTLSRTFKAPRQRVFDAWTNPEKIKQWFGCKESVITSVVSDLRVGGEYEIQMAQGCNEEGPSGLKGKYTTVNPPEELSYTWGWQGFEGGSQETRVTVKFVEDGEFTRLELKHEGFVNEEICGMHTSGWSQSFDKFEKLVS